MYYFGQSSITGSAIRVYCLLVCYMALSPLFAQVYVERTLNTSNALSNSTAAVIGQPDDRGLVLGTDQSKLTLELQETVPTNGILIVRVRNNNPDQYSSFQLLGGPNARKLNPIGQHTIDPEQETWINLSFKLAEPVQIVQLNVQNGSMLLDAMSHFREQELHQQAFGAADESLTVLAPINEFADDAINLPVVNEHRLVIRLEDLAIEKQETLLYANLNFDVSAAIQQGGEVVLRVEQPAKAGPINPPGIPINERNWSNQYVTWSIPPGSEQLKTPDIRSLLEVPSSQKNWSSGNAINISIQGDPGLLNTIQQAFLLSGPQLEFERLPIENINKQNTNLMAGVQALKGKPQLGITDPSQGVDPSIVYNFDGGGLQALAVFFQDANGAINLEETLVIENGAIYRDQGNGQRFFLGRMDPDLELTDTQIENQLKPQIQSAFASKQKKKSSQNTSSSCITVSNTSLTSSTSHIFILATLLLSLINKR
ncbi:MAG: hypothetical protein AAFV80_15740, partial [Bacteroidota bacterium]